MKITFDLNCVIALENNEPTVHDIKELIKFHNKNRIDITIPGISASEQPTDNIIEQSFQDFKKRIEELSARNMCILQPLAVWDFTFWEYCIWTTDEMENLEKNIYSTLFPGQDHYWPDYARTHNISEEVIDKRYRNMKCDSISLWCHIYYGTDIFVTSDNHFLKKSVFPKLKDLGAKLILRPEETLTLIKRNN